jgi:hypothetical protein
MNVFLGEKDTAKPVPSTTKTSAPTSSTTTQTQATNQPKTQTTTATVPPAPKTKESGTQPKAPPPPAPKPKEAEKTQTTPAPKSKESEKTQTTPAPKSDQLKSQSTPQPTVSSAQATSSQPKANSVNVLLSEDPSPSKPAPTGTRTSVNVLLSEEAAGEQTKTPASISVLVGQIPNSNERSRIERVLSVFFGDTPNWKNEKINLENMKEMINSIEISYELQRFKATFNHPRIKYLSFSKQLGYVLGWENPLIVQNNEKAKYGSDLRGKISLIANLYN